MTKQDLVLNLIRKLRTESSAIFESRLAILDSKSLSFDQAKMIAAILSEHQQNLSKIADLAKKLYEEE